MVSGATGGEFDHTCVDVTRSNAVHRYEEHALAVVSDKQTHVLRTNKVIREVSRALGAEWRPVFERLTCVLPQDAVNEAMKKIESARSFMQVCRSSC